jgi:YD repeat-containing protein
VDSEYTANFNISDTNPYRVNISTGTTDAAGYSTILSYTDNDSPDKPTVVIDKGGRQTTYSYDAHGNLESATDPRLTTTTYTYMYPGDPGSTTSFPFGRLVSVQEGTKSPTSFVYYEPSGLVHTITSPQPGTIGGTATVTTAFTYDSLGNVLTVTAPGNNAASSITTTYNYTQDGTYTQSAKLGQPLTVTDNLGHATHFRYDARGNVIHVEDALGNATDSVYNIADQLMTTISPSTSTP